MAIYYVHVVYPDTPVPWRGNMRRFFDSLYLVATIRINAGQWDALSEEQKRQVHAILQAHGTLHPDDTIVGDAEVEPVYSPVESTESGSEASHDGKDDDAVCTAGYAIAVAACQSIAPPGSSACLAVAMAARNLCRAARTR